MNITQEGKDDVDDLRELGLINGLKLSSGGFQVIFFYISILKIIYLYNLYFILNKLKNEIEFIFDRFEFVSHLQPPPPPLFLFLTFFFFFFNYLGCNCL